MSNNTLKSVMNVGNNNNQTGMYPLFLGEDLGFTDEINITYPDIHKVYKEQQSMFWLEDEFHFNQDRQDLLDAPDSEKDVMVLNLLAQHLMDSVASRSIIEIFGPVISNTELHNWLLTQSFFEGIHASTYMKIFRNCFSDGNAVLERGKHNLDVFNRSKRIGEVFNMLNQKVSAWVSDSVTVKPTAETMRLALLKGMVTLYALEQISFMSSFASTFALVETGRYTNIGKAISSICADEMVHAKGDRIVIQSMFSEPSIDTGLSYKELFNKHKQEFVDIIDAITKQEMEWSTYIFSEGRKVLGLNEQLLQGYVNYMAQPLYNFLEIAWDTNKFGTIVNDNPLPFMNVYIDRDLIQTANQESTNNNYRVGQVVDDLDGEVFDF